MNKVENIEVYQDGQLISSEQINYTDQDILEFEKQKYHIRKVDGENTFLLFAADLRMQKVNGIISETELVQIEELLFPVRTEITLGQWKTALKKLNDINPASIGVDLYNKIESTILNYISESYTI